MRERTAAFLYDRALWPGRRLQMAAVHLGDRRASAAVAAHVARLSLDYVSIEREALERAIDVVSLWSQGNADDEGLIAARRDTSAAIARADAEGDRCACTCLLAAASLFDLALEPVFDVGAKRARDLAGYLLDAMCWPDVNDPALRETFQTTLHEVLDERFDETRSIGFDPPPPSRRLVDRR